MKVLYNGSVLCVLHMLILPSATFKSCDVIWFMQLGWTALHHAARNGNVEICKLLVSHGGNPEITNHVSHV